MGSRRRMYAAVSALCALLGFAALLALFIRIPGQQANSSVTGATSESRAAQAEGTTISVDARQIWTDTGIFINRGDVLNFNASGNVTVASPGDAADKWVGPDGWGYIPLMYCNGQPCRYVFRYPNSMGCLIGKIGDSKVFNVGSHRELTAQTDGTLYLSVNDGISDQNGRLLDDSSAAAMLFSDNRGSFNVTVAFKTKSSGR